MSDLNVRVALLARPDSVILAALFSHRFLLSAFFKIVIKYTLREIYPSNRSLSVFCLLSHVPPIAEVDVSFYIWLIALHTPRGVFRFAHMAA